MTKKLKRPLVKMDIGGTTLDAATGAVVGTGGNTISRPSAWSSAAGGTSGAGNAAGIVGGVATLGNGLMDAIDTPDQYGYQSSGVTIGKSTLTGAATGAVAGSVLPGIGTAVGAVVGGAVGAVSGVLNAKKIKRKEAKMFSDANTSRVKYDNAVSAALTKDPGQINGYQNASYFALGGQIGGLQRPASANTGLQGPGQPADTTVLGTKLDPGTEVAYQTWKTQLPKNLQWEGDYDLRGLYKSDPNVKPSPNLHFPDTYKLPNHPTFSNESIYFNDQTRSKAGHWQETDSSWNYMPYDTKVKKMIVEKKMADGGQLGTSPMANMSAIGGNLKSLNSNATEVVGNSHANGGVKVPDLGVEMEGGETMNGDFVFSKKLGFAQLHRPIAAAIGKIEQKPQTQERVNALNLLKDREQRLALAQEHFKQLNSLS